MELLEIKQWIKNHFKTDTFTLINNHKGISNQNFDLFIQNDHYILRAPRNEHKALMILHDNEKHILDQVKDIDVPLIYFDTKTGIKITRYIEDNQTFETKNDTEAIIRFAKTLSILHKKPCPDFTFDPIYKYTNYKKQTIDPIIKFSHEDKTIMDFKALYCPDTLCHNDLVAGNILYSKDQTYLIDYEYAAANDYRFDIASFLSENNIQDQKKRNAFYQAYFNYQVPQNFDKQIHLFEKFEDLLWGYWANMLYEKRHDQIYKEIALDKMKHYSEI